MYSLKSIHLPPRKLFWTRITERTESVIKRMHWKSFFENLSTTSSANEFGFKTCKSSPKVKDIETFEDDLWNIRMKVRFRHSFYPFLRSLNDYVT
uniref:Uncharacterized protein n=1 Tax=Octopus bimaculoides TaxID=37653 RepID=A0A0L8I5C0_OCTBM